MHVQLIAKPEYSVTGISRFTEDLRGGLQAAGLDAELTFPIQPPIPGPLQRALLQTGMDPRRFFANYPLRARLAKADVYHLVGQMLATLLLFQRFPAPVAVSVLDIIPYLVRHDAELSTFRHPMDKLFYRLALYGLTRAGMLIAISQYTRQTLIDTLDLPADRISVVYPAVNHAVFRPQPVPDAFRARHGLSTTDRHVLFVGSEDRRKNIRTLVKAFALAKQTIPRLKLLKVGAAQFPAERQKLLRLIRDLEIEEDVLLLDVIDENELPLIYNSAALLVLPSFYEGFGLPVAEAMACGTPVICSRSASLPEVVGDAALQVDADDICELADRIVAVLDDDAERARLSDAGREQASRFNLQRVAAETAEVYTRLYDSRRQAIRD